MHETGTAKQRARTTRLHTTIETPSDITYVDRTEASLRADLQSPWACKESTPSKMWATIMSTANGIR
jgi:hypothetical protein